MVLLICIFIAQIVHYYFDREEINFNEDLQNQIKGLKNKKISVSKYWELITKIDGLKGSLNNKLEKLDYLNNYHEEKELIYMKNILEKQVSFNIFLQTLSISFFIAFFTVGSTLIFNFTNQVGTALNEYTNETLETFNSDEMVGDKEKYFEKLNQSMDIKIDTIKSMFNYGLIGISIFIIIFLIYKAYYDNKISKVKEYLSWVEYLIETKK
ncbi:hypothetical protein [Solibacillus ferritrahens]|uniref:hypothetical protein n=1 Tax=Solibacillus ferritrahens TaxID=3098620 RepID=UPI00300B9751